MAPAIYGLSKLISLDQREGLRGRFGGSASECLYAVVVRFLWEFFVDLFANLMTGGKVL